MEFRTCTYIHDDGNLCNSAAVTDRNLCFYHLDHRARLMRMAQYRARGQRFDLQLPPLESMHAVQSALTQLSEALAADMIELKRADRLIRVLNLASRNLLKADKWPASPYHSEQPAPAVNLTANYGLPNDLDLNTLPELAFPPPPSLDLSSRAEAAVSAAGVEGPAFSSDGTHSSPMPTVDYCSSTAPAVQNTPSAPTTPRRLSSPSFTRSSKPKAWTPPSNATSSSNATSVAATSPSAASATPPSRWRRTCASPPSA